MNSRFNYFIAKSSTLIYKLCIEKGCAKKRLIESELEIQSVLRAPVPDSLLPLKNKIKHNFLHSGTRPYGNNQASTGFSSYGKRNSTASKIILDIIKLHHEV